jgi:hypothetical protein
VTLPENPVKWAIDAFRSDRAQRYALYRQYLEGEHPMRFPQEHLRKAFGNTFRNFYYNRCGTVVDAHADRLQVVGFDSDDEDERRKQREEALFAGLPVPEADKTIAQQAQELWDANNMDAREGQIDVEMFGMGDGYLLVDMDPTTGEVFLWPQRADEIRVRYDDTRPGDIELAAKAWMDEDEHMRLNLYFRDRIEKYRTTNRALSGMPTSPRAFEPYQPESDTTWPVMLNVPGTVPVFHFANNARVNDYGHSELAPVLPLQDMLNRDLTHQAIASVSRIARQWVLLNYDASDDDNKQQIENLQIGTLQAIALPPNREGEHPPQIAEFSAADMEQFDLVAEKWDIRISRVSRVPVHYLTMTGNFPSGESLRMGEAQFITKMQDRAVSAAATYGAAMTYALRLQGVNVEPGQLRVNMAPVAPMGEKESWELAEIQHRLGMPLRQILKERGYEPEQIAAIERQIRDEMDAADERRRTLFNGGVYDALAASAGGDE